MVMKLRNTLIALATCLATQAAFGAGPTGEGFWCHEATATNLTLTLSNPVNGWEVGAYVKNATDEEAITDFYLTDDSSGLFRNAFYTEPRTYGVSLQKRF